VLFRSHCIPLGHGSLPRETIYILARFFFSLLLFPIIVNLGRRSILLANLSLHLTRALLYGRFINDVVQAHELIMTRIE
jgi:hypothetical protein